MQRALAAEAEAELLEIKLTGAFEELRVDRAGCVASLSYVYLWMGMWAADGVVQKPFCGGCTDAGSFALF